MEFSSKVEFDEYIITLEPIFKYNDEVCSKKTGYPGIGKVLAHIPGYVYAAFHQTDWKIYPDWKEKSVYLVGFETARKNLTFEECEKYYPTIKEDALKKYYDDLIESQIIWYPEDDLEIYE